MARRITVVFRLGVVSLEDNRLTLRNKSGGNATYTLDSVGAERWRSYLIAHRLVREGAKKTMAWSGKRGKKKGTMVRLTGLFKTKTRGLFVGGVDGENLDLLIARIKKAKAEGKGLVVFLWKNEDTEGNQPKYTLNADVARDREDTPRRNRKPIEPDPEDEPEEDEADEDEDPFADDDDD